MNAPIPNPRPCPICGKLVIATPHRPFCSARCKTIDLGRWLGGTYRIETDETPEGDGVVRDEE